MGRRVRGVKRAWRKYGNYDTAKKALQIALMTKKLVNVERKYFDVTDTGSTVSSTPTLTHLTAMAQGDDVTNRSGNSVRLQSVMMRYQPSQHASATNSIVRVILFQWMDDDAPVATDILDNNAGWGQPNLEKAAKYRILLDHVFKFSDSSMRVDFFKYFKELNTHVRYDSTAGTDYAKGSLWLMELSNEGTNLPTVARSTRVRFIDN